MSWRETTLGEITDLKRGFDLPKSQRLQGDVRVIHHRELPDLIVLQQ